MSGTILAHPSDLTSAGSSLKIRVSDIQQVLSTIKSATNGASSALSASSVLAPAAAELEGTLGGMETVLGCFENALFHLGTGLERASEDFKTTDAALAAMLSRIDQSLLSYTGFEVQPVPTPAPAKKTHHSWWQTALNITGAVGLGLAGAGAIVLGGGPEDPVGDAAAVAAWQEAYALAA
jgi:hypothetical protein